MKFFAIIFAAINTWIGLRFLANVFGWLQTSKYGSGATIVYAVLFTGLGLAGAYFIFFVQKQATGFWLGLAPWLFSGIFLFINMLTEDYK